jgi:hypothetical protein
MACPVKTCPAGRIAEGATGQYAARLQIRMRNPAHVPKLQGDPAAGAVDRSGHLLPASDLFRRMNAGRAPIAMALVTDRRGLGQDRPARRALAIVLDRQRRRNIAGTSTVARQ